MSKETNRPDPSSGEPDVDIDSSVDADVVDAVSSDDEVVEVVSSDDEADEVVDTDGDAGVSAVSVESLLDDLERVTNERDGYLDDMRRVAAEFSNFRRQTDKRYAEIRDQAATSLAEQLLPVLDACDGALAHGADDVEPIYNMLIATLEKSGLSVLRPLGEPFDPNCHEAVMHEEGDGDGPHVAEVLRTGYVWNGRVLRPALVKVRD